MLEGLTTPMPASLNNSVLRAFAILDLFGDERAEITAGEVAAELCLNMVTAHRFLKTLAATGALVSPRKGVYRLGYRLLDYAERAGNARRLARLLQPCLNELSARSDEGAMATVFDGTWVTSIATSLSSQAIVFNARVGARHEPHATANGKLWLAHIGEDRLRRYLADNELTAFSNATIVDEPGLRRELEAIRARGYATNRAEREAGLNAVAVPLFSRTGEMLSGVSVFAPSFRLAEEDEPKLATLIGSVLDRVDKDLYGVEHVPAGPRNPELEMAHK